MPPGVAMLRRVATRADSAFTCRLHYCLDASRCRYAMPFCRYLARCCHMLLIADAAAGADILR